MSASAAAIVLTIVSPPGIAMRALDTACRTVAV
jgi:hypothetical protein